MKRPLLKKCGTLGTLVFVRVFMTLNVTAAPLLAGIKPNTSNGYVCGCGFLNYEERACNKFIEVIYLIIYIRYVNANE